MFVGSLITLLSGARVHADVVAVESLSALPVCLASYADPEATVAGGKVAGPAGALYCTFGTADIENAENRVLGRMGDRIQRFLAQSPDLVELRLSAAYFESDNVARWLCQQGLARNLPVSVYVQRAQGALVHLDQRFRNRLDTCFDHVRYIEIGCDVWDPQTGATCPNKQTNTHHIKAMWLRGTSSSLHVFGTGNFSLQSLVANIEDWTAIETTSVQGRSSRLSCFWPVLDALAARPALTYAEQSGIWSDCLAQADDTPGIDLYVLPFARNAFRDQLKIMFAQAISISLVAEVLESDYMIDLIEGASGEVTLYLDDAYYYTAKDPMGTSFAHVDPANARRIRTLGGLPNVTIRYLQTNHHPETGAHNSVHARVILFETPGGAVSMSGSTQFKDGAWRLNTEQQIFFDPQYADMHRDYFQELYKRSVEEGELPKANVRAFSK